MSIVTDDDVEKALSFLRRNCNVAAKARADRLYLEEFKKTKKARFGVLAAQITCDAWRSQQANERAMGKLQ